MQNTKIFKKESWPIFIVKALGKSFVLAFIITIVIGFASGFRHMYVATGSMSPTVPTGSIIITKNINFKDVEVGDIVTFRAGNSYVTHRAVARTTDSNKVLLVNEIRWITEFREDFRNGIWTGELLDSDIGNTIENVDTVTEHNFVAITIYYAPGVGSFINYINKGNNPVILIVFAMIAIFILTFV